MANLNADRNLLFGILAVQMDFLKRDALIAAMNAWVLAKDKPLGQILVDQGALSRERHGLLDALVQEHLKAHHDDPEKSLAAAGCAGPVRDALRQVADADVHASLACIAPPIVGGSDLYATREEATGLATSSGLRFRILRPHARGGLGEVLVAEDKELHREVALKHIQDQLADEPASRARFLLEAEITGGLEHPGVVPVYGLGQYGDGRPFYAMRFIRGDSFRDAIARFHKADEPNRDPGERTLQLHQMLQRFIAVCQAIAYAHSRGVLHRDLKPGNIMLGEYGETLVVDWGLAKVVGHAEPESRLPPLTAHSSGTSDATLPGQMVGTPAYMAPEQAQGRLDLMDERTDVYGLGGILFEILTGRAPHEGTDVYAILKSAIADPSPRARTVAPSVHPALEAICARAMAGDHKVRYARAGDLAADVQRFLADEPVGAWREPWKIRARRWVTRHRTFVTAGAAVVVAAAVLLAVTAVLLQSAYHRESLAHAQAEQNYQRAREAVNQYYTEVSEDRLLREPGMEPLRKKLLTKAQDYYDKFVQERGADPTAREDLALALYRLGQITGDIESERKGIDLLLKALPLFTALAAERPGDPGRQRNLADCYHHLGRLYRLTDRMAEAEDAYKNALAVWEPLVRDHPQEDAYQAGLARSQLGLGNVYRATRRLDEASDLYEKARTRRESLSRAHPDDADYQRDVGVVRHNLAVVSQALGKNEKAETTYTDALEIQEKLGRNPDSLKQYKNDLARSHYDLAHLYTKTGRFDAAIAGYKDAADLWEKLSQQNPAVLDFAMSRAEAWGGLTEAYYAANQPTAAEQAGQQCLALRKKLADEQQETPIRRGELARAQYYLGQIYRAEGQAAKAEPALEEARRIQEPLSALPDAYQYQGDLARTLNELGGLHLDGGNGADAGKELHKALGLWEPLLHAHADQPEYIQGLTTCTYYLGQLCQADGQAPAALDRYTQALRTLQEGDASLKGDAVALSLNRNIHWKRAEVLVKLGRYGESLPDWDQAVALTADPEKDWLRLDRARTLALAGEHARAAAEAMELTDKALNENDPLYSLACVYSLCIAAASRDAHLPPEQQRKAADAYADQALELLGKVRTAGYFQKPENLERLKKDPDLDPMRERPAFKIWMNQS